jgi:hypothetical protein
VIADPQRKTRTARLALLLIAVIAVGLLSFAGSVGAASGRALLQAKFELKAAGFQVAVETEASEEKVVLSLYRRGQVAIYQAPATFTEDSLHARFGRFGELDYTFTEDPVSKDCRGLGKGTFNGTFTFTGENDFVHFEADRARGTLFATGSPGCKEGPGPRLSSPHFRPGAAAPGRAKPVEEVTLSAHSRKLPIRFLLVFTTEYKGREQAFFNAFRQEKLEGMVIARGVQTSGGLGTFRWDLDAGTARLDPPAPFLGSAVLRPRSSGPPSWSGSLRVPVLGGKPIRLAGPGMVSELDAGSPID